MEDFDAEGKMTSETCSTVDSDHLECASEDGDGDFDTKGGLAAVPAAPFGASWDVKTPVGYGMRWQDEDVVGSPLSSLFSMPTLLPFL